MSDNPVGSASQIAWGFEISRCVPDLSSLYGLTVEKENLGAKRTEDENRNQHPSQEELEGSRVKIDLGGSLDRLPDADSIVRLLTHLEGWADITTPAGATAARQWEIRKMITGDAALARYINSLYLLAYRDDEFEEMLLGGKIDKMNLKIEKNKLLDLSFGATFSHQTHLDDPSVAGGISPTYDGQLVFRGNTSDELGGNIKIKATVAGQLDGTGQVECTIGATAYGGATRRIAVTAGVWYDFMKADGSFEAADWPAERLQFMFTAGSGGAGDPTNAFVVDQEWTAVQKRGKTTVVVPSSKPLSGAGAFLTVDGDDIEVEGCAIERIVPRLAYFTTGSGFASRVIDNGKRKAMISFDRMYLDRTLLRHLKKASKIAFKAKMYGDLIEAGFYNLWQIDAGFCKFRDAGTDGISGPDALKEKPALYATYDEDTGTPAIVHTVTCSTTTLA